MGAMDTHGTTQAGWRPDGATVRRLVDEAQAATGTRWVHMTWLDTGSGQVVPLAWSGRRTALLRRAVEAIRRQLPGARPEQLHFSPECNPLMQQIYGAGVPVSAPFADLASGAVPPVGVAVGTGIGGLLWVFACPVRLGECVAGCIAFHTRSPANRRRRMAFLAIARMTAGSLRRAHALEKASEENEDLRRSRAVVTAAEEHLRRSIADELQGQVQSRLLAATQALADSESLWDTDPQRARVTLARVRREVEALRDHDLRLISQRLHPVLIDTGLGPALQSLVGRFGHSAEVRLLLDTQLDRADQVAHRIPAGVRLTAYRAVEEGLAAAVWHGRAGHVDVRLGMEPETLWVEMEDDGEGPPAGSLANLDLAGIAARVDHYAGTWTQDPRLGGGRILRVRLPLRQVPRWPG